MKKSINIWSFPSGFSLEQKMKLAKDAGFQGFEPDLTETGPLGLGGNPSSWAKVRELADRTGLELSGLATGLYWGANGASSDPGVRRKTARILETQIACAQALGVDAILVIPGMVGADFLPEGELVPYGLAYERATELIRNALPRAEAAGVTIAVENVWNKFLLSPLEMRGFIDQFGSRHAASYFDAGNILATGYPEHWIPLLGRRISRVHLKDYRRTAGGVHGFVELLSGDIHWPAVMQALKGIGYRGWLAAEMIPPIPFYRHSPETLIHNTSRAMDALLEMAA
jgi:hexulose-6-phosphate isomerase